MTAAEVARMRTCFAVAAVWEGWTPEEQAEIAAEIRQALDSGDPEIIQYWQAWLEEMSCLERLGELCRAAERRIKEIKGKKECSE